MAARKSGLPPVAKRYYLGFKQAAGERLRHVSRRAAIGQTPWQEEAIEVFVRYLNERQQAALLHYAHEMMRVDGSVAGDELVYLDVIRDQAQTGVEAEDVPMEELSTLFDDRLSRVAFLLEVVGMGYANRDFDPSESRLAKDLARALPVEGEGILEHVESWVKRQLLLMGEAHQMMGAR